MSAAGIIGPARDDASTRMVAHALVPGPSSTGAVSVPREPVVAALAALVRDVELRTSATAGDRIARSPAPETSVGEADPTDAGPTGTALLDTIAPELSTLLAQAKGDPILLLSLLDATFQSTRLEGDLQNVEAAREGAERAAAERERAIDRAIERAGRARRIPKWLKTMLKAIAMAASTIAAAVTGGALAAVAIAGAVLMLAAEHIGKLAVELGMDPNKAKWLVASLQIAGAAMSMAGGGAGAAGAAQHAEALQNAAQLTSRIVGAASSVMEGSDQIARAVARYRAGIAQGAADEAAVRAGAANLELEDAVRVLRDGMRTLERSLEADAELLRLREEATQAVLHRAI